MINNTTFCKKNKYLFSCFLSIRDPRQQGRCTYPLINILVIVLCGLICGCDGWKAMALFAKTKRRLLSQWIDLSEGVPSALTLARVFSLINPHEFERCLEDWMQSICQLITDDIISIDGKTLRGSAHEQSGKRASHIINAYHPRLQATLATIKTPDKSNEIKGITHLLKALALKDNLVSIDAMGTQKGIAKLIRLQQGHYLLALKANHKKLYKKVDNLFNKAQENKYKQMIVKEKSSFEYDHSRIEERTYTVLPAMYLPVQQMKPWVDLSLLIKVHTTRQLTSGQVQQATRYYLSSLPYKKTNLATDAIRQHWHIENRLHYKLDVGLREDNCPIFRGHAAVNLAIMRKIVLKLLTDEKSSSQGISMKRIQAALSTRYLKKIVNF